MARRLLSAGFLLFSYLSGGHQTAQQLIERFFEVQANGSALVDVDALEEGLVEQAAVMIVGLHVGRVAVTGQIEALGEVGASVLVGGLSAGESILDARELARDAVLLSLE